MKRSIQRRELIELVDGDAELVELLIEHEILVATSDCFGVVDVDRLLAARTLFRDLRVNIEGVDVVLRLREELALARKLLEALKKAAD